MSVAMMEQKRKPENWNDDRLDDLNRKVDRGLEKVDEGFAEVRTEFRALRGEMQTESRAIREEIASSRRTLVQAAAAIWVTAMIGFLGVIATVLTKV